MRPGGTVSGPAIFALADLLAAIPAMIGPHALAVTANCNLCFLLKTAAGIDLVAKIRVLKLRRVFAVGNARILSDKTDALIAHASMAYSIPRVRG